MALTWMPRLGFRDHVNRQQSDRCDAELIGRLCWYSHSCVCCDDGAARSGCIEYCVLRINLRSTSRLLFVLDMLHGRMDFHECHVCGEFHVTSSEASDGRYPCWKNFACIASIALRSRLSSKWSYDASHGYRVARKCATDGFFFGLEHLNGSPRKHELLGLLATVCTVSSSSP